MTRRSTLLLLLSFFLHACGYLVRRFRSKPLNRFNFDRSGQTNEPRNIINIVKSILNENNKTESLLNIIAYGDKFLEKSSSDNVREQVSDFSRNIFLSSLNANGWNKVPGCLSDVRVKASIIAESNVVSVIGVADSRIARGLIAILCDVSMLEY